MSSVELCGRRCMGEYCKVHLARLRKGPGTKPCRVCGVGVKNKLSLCLRCGYKNEHMKLLHREQRAVEKESARLRYIEIPI